MYNRAKFNLHRFNLQEVKPNDTDFAESFVAEFAARLSLSYDIYDREDAADGFDGRFFIGAATVENAAMLEGFGASAAVGKDVYFLFDAGENIGAESFVAASVTGEAAAAEYVAALLKIAVTVAGGALSLEQIKAILEATEFPVAYDHFISEPKLPFILFMRLRSPNFYADDKVFERVNRWQIILVTEKKSRATEKKLEAILDEFGIPYSVEDEAYIKEERVYQIMYEFEEMEG